MNRAAAAVAVLFAAIAGVAVWQWRAEREPLPAVPPASGVPAPAEVPSGAPMQADLSVKPAPAKPAVAAVGSVRFPDGSSMPALNGVKTDIVITWGSGPFTRVVGTEDGPDGWKWYVHENGARSTTAMIPHNGIPKPTGVVAEPKQVLPPLMEVDSKSTGKPPRTGGQ